MRKMRHSIVGVPLHAVRSCCVWQSRVARLGIEVQPLAPHASAGLDQKRDVQVPREAPSAAGIALALDLEHTLSIHTCVPDSV